MTDAPAAIEMIDGVPCGWCFERSSWPAHREFYRQFRRPMVFGEYSKLLRARGAGGECLSKPLNVWRLIAAQGETVIVQRTSNTIRQILPADWTAPPPAPSSPARPAQPRPQKKVSNPSPAPASVVVRRLTANELRRRLGLPVS